MKNQLFITLTEKNCRIRFTTEKNGVICFEKEKTILGDFEQDDTLSLALIDIKSYYTPSAIVTVHIPTKHIISRDFLLEDRLSDAEIVAFFSGQSEKLFGHPAVTIYFDYIRHSPIQDGKEKVTVIAAHVAFIRALQKMFLTAGMPIHIIDVEKNINLLPWRDIKKQKQQRILLFRLIAYLFLFFICCIFLRYFLIYETKWLTSETKKITLRSEKISLTYADQHQLLLKKIKSIADNKRQSKTHNMLIAEQLSSISNELPADTTLTSLVLTNKKITLAGNSQKLSSINHYVNDLKKSLSWKKLQLSEIKNNPKAMNLMHFTLEITP